MEYQSNSWTAAGLTGWDDVCYDAVVELDVTLSRVTPNRRLEIASKSSSRFFGNESALRYWFQGKVDRVGTDMLDQVASHEAKIKASFVILDRTQYQSNDTYIVR